MNGVNKVLSNGELEGKSNSTRIVYEFDIPIKVNDDYVELLKRYDISSNERLKELLRTMSLKCEWGPDLMRETKQQRSSNLQLERYATIRLTNTVATILSISLDNMEIHISTIHKIIIDHHNDIFAYPRALKKNNEIARLITFDLYPKLHEPARGC